MHKADLLMVRRHIICSNFCKEVFVEDIAEATSIMVEGYFYTKDKIIILQNKKIKNEKLT